jgi:thiol-disulfide isomerase/thioredoxin
MILLILFLSGCNETSIDGIDFVFTDLDGNERHLSEFYGKIIVLDLMGVNCQPCFFQMFELERIFENYSSDDVTIISIDVWVKFGENRDLLQTYIEYLDQDYNLDLNWTFGLDDTSGTIFDNYVSGGVPTLYIIDRNGNIYYTFSGYQGYQALASKIDELLS